MPEQSQKSTDLLGHPRGLVFLFGTEMWERFSYYGMRALLTLYMVHFLLLPGAADHVWGLEALKSGFESVFGPLGTQAFASQIYGSYTALVYLSPVFGGLLADRWLGQRLTVVIGCILMAFGHFLMAVQSLFLPALFLLILGCGAFKPNTTTQVGMLYPPQDHRRDRAYSIFYVGINLGAFLSPLICGTLGEEIGWHYGFGAAGVGMLLSLVIYLLGTRHLPPDQKAEIAAIQQSVPLTRKEWGTILAIIVLGLLNIFFWGTYEQQGNTIALWADANTDRAVHLGQWVWEIPTTWFQSFNPLMIFAFTPLIVGFWRWQTDRGREPSTVTKMAFGLLGAALSYGIMAFAAWQTGDGEKTSWLWLLLYFVTITTSELYLSPVGLSMVSKLAPGKILSMMMGLWFIFVFAGNFLAGWLGSFWSDMDKVQFFLMIAGIAGAAGMAVLLLRKLLLPYLEE